MAKYQHVYIVVVVHRQFPTNNTTVPCGVGESSSKCIFDLFVCDTAATAPPEPNS